MTSTRNTALIVLVCSLLVEYALQNAEAAGSSNNMMQVFAFNISGTATQQAATCQQLCQLLQQPTSAPSPAPFYHACGGNWRNITTVFRRSTPTDCGGFSFFNDLAAATQYWKVLAVHPTLLARRATTKAQAAKQATSSATPAASVIPDTYGRITGEAWSGVPVPADSELLRGLQPPSAKPAAGQAAASNKAAQPSLLSQLPFIHLVQYQVKPGPDGRPVPGIAEGALQQLKALAAEAAAHVPGYKGWVLIAAAPRPAGVTLGPWFDLAGFVPYPSESVLEGHMNYALLHSTMHRNAVKDLSASAHVMFETGRASPETQLFAPNYSALNSSITSSTAGGSGGGSTGGRKPSG